MAVSSMFFWFATHVPVSTPLKPVGATSFSLPSLHESASFRSFDLWLVNLLFSIFSVWIW